jgi:hypothetical protein
MLNLRFLSNHMSKEICENKNMKLQFNSKNYIKIALKTPFYVKYIEIHVFQKRNYFCMYTVYIVDILEVLLFF